MPITHALIDLLYPPACLSCHAPLHAASLIICRACRAGLPSSRRPMCQRCGQRLRSAFDTQLTCAACRQRPPTYAAARSPWSYTGTIPRLVRQFKYHRRWRLGRWLARGMTRTAQQSWPVDAIDLVVPVPLHWLKKRLKGFNHAAALARSTARRLGCPYAPSALRRHRWTRSQTRLTPAARRRNVRAAFAASDRLLHGKTILLIDDVLTSGATAEACARTLRAAGARRIFVLTAARTPAPTS